MSLGLLMLGCVIRYGDPVEPVPEPPPPPTAEFTAGFTELNAHLVELMRSARDADQIERLRAGQNLIHRARAQSPQAQKMVLDYLRLIVEIEARMIATGEGMGGGFSVDLPPVEEEELSTPVEVEALGGEGVDGERGGVDEPNRLSQTDTTAMRQRARSFLSMDDPEGAMAVLSACAEQPCWTEVEELWRHARDVYIRQQSQSALDRFREVLSEADAARRSVALTELKRSLGEMLQTYPQTRYTNEVAALVSRIEDELRALDGR